MGEEQVSRDCIPSGNTAYFSWSLVEFASPKSQLRTIVPDEERESFVQGELGKVLGTQVDGERPAKQPTENSENSGCIFSLSLFILFHFL